MFCKKCGAQLPDDAIYCMKCGTPVAVVQQTQTQQPTMIIAPSGVTSLKCPTCGAPISPKFGEMVITCEHCGTGVVLSTQGWTNMEKQTMLPLKVADSEQLNTLIKPMMDRGLLHRHLMEDSTQEEMSLTYVPYWIVSVSARTTIAAPDETGQIEHSHHSSAHGCDFRRHGWRIQRGTEICCRNPRIGRNTRTEPF